MEVQFFIIIVFCLLVLIAAALVLAVDVTRETRELKKQLGTQDKYIKIGKKYDYSKH